MTTYNKKVKKLEKNAKLSYSAQVHDGKMIALFKQMVFYICLTLTY